MEGSLYGQLFLTGAKHKLVPGGVQLDDIRITLLFDGEIYKPRNVTAKVTTVSYVSLCMHNGLYIYVPSASAKRFSYVIEKGTHRKTKHVVKADEKQPAATQAVKKQQAAEKAQPKQRVEVAQPEWLKALVPGDLNCGESFIFGVEGAHITMKTSVDGKLSKPYYLRIFSPKGSADRFVLFDARKQAVPITSSPLNNVNCKPAQKFITNLAKDMPHIPVTNLPFELEAATAHALDVLSQLQAPQATKEFELTATDGAGKDAINEQFDELFGDVEDK
jgi:hypothetical protein